MIQKMPFRERNVLKMRLLQKEGASGKKLPLLLLLAVGVIEFLFITLESQLSGIGYYLAENYVIVPCLLLLGYGLQQKQTPFARRRLLLAGMAIAWFVICQCIHTLSGMENHPMATVFLVYLMAFPFASLAEDHENAGLRLMGSVFVAASLVLVGYSVLMLLDMVPESMKQYLFWDGARLNALWHPNIVAGYLMIGIGFSLAFCAMARKNLTKVLLIIAVLLQLAAMALTNCRTTLLLTGAMLGGTLFFLIFRKGGWIRFVLGLMVAGIVLAGSFKLTGTFFQWNNDRLLKSFSAAQAEQVPAADEQPAAGEMSFVKVTDVEAVVVEVPAAEKPVVETAEAVPAEGPAAKEQFILEETGVLTGDNEQRSLAEDMRSLNGRTQIWEATLKVLKNNKAILLWGTEYSGTMISIYHWFDVYHAHNSWLETQMRMGLPGLMMALVFTVLSVWSAAKLLLSSKTELWKKIVAMLAMCVMASGFLEPYLFITNVYYHVTDFIFFFLTGYLDFWSNFKQKNA